MIDSYRMTVPDQIRYLHQQVVTSLTTQDEQMLSSLSTTLMELSESALHYGDKETYDVLDDLSYAVNETLMGAAVKGESVLTDVATKIAKLAAVDPQP